MKHKRVWAVEVKFLDPENNFSYYTPDLDRAKTTKLVYSHKIENYTSIDITEHILRYSRKDVSDNIIYDLMPIMDKMYNIIALMKYHYPHIHSKVINSKIKLMRKTNPNLYFNQSLGLCMRCSDLLEV